MKRVATIVTVVLAAFTLYLLTAPTPVDPVAWQPPPNPGLDGPFAANTALAAIEQLVELGPGPEDMARGPDGLIYTGLQDGRIVRFDPDDGAPPETFVDTGGRPLGMDFDRHGRLYVADAFAGLLAIDPDGTLDVLVAAIDGEPLGFTNDLDLGVPGKIIFTDSSRRFDQHHYMLDFIEGRSTGRLLSYDLASGATEIVRDGLGFANGVAASPGGDVWFAETLAARITRISRDELDEPGSGSDGEPGAAGRTDSATVLPAYPDNLSFDAARTTLWVALPAVRPNPIELLAGWPFVRKVLSRVPGIERIDAAPYSMVLGLDTGGRVVHNLQDPAARYPKITSVKEIDGYLYFGSIAATSLGRMPVPTAR